MYSSLDETLVYRRVTLSSKFAGTLLLLYIWVEKGIIRVKCLATDGRAGGLTGLKPPSPHTLFQYDDYIIFLFYCKVSMNKIIIKKENVLESYLLHLVTRIYKATTLFKTCRKLFVFSYMYFLTHTGKCTKAGIYCKRLKNMYQAHKTSKMFFFCHITLIQVLFFLEIFHAEG